MAKDNSLENVREIDQITQVIEDGKLRQFLITFLKQEIDCDETTGMIEELQLTAEEIRGTTELFIQHGCVLCTELFLLHFRTQFDPESLTQLAEVSVKYRQIEMLKILHNHGAILLEDFLTIAIVNLDTQTVKYLIFLEVNIDDNDADTLIDFIATRSEGYEIYLILEELLRAQGRMNKFKDALRLANEADNEKLASYLMRKSLRPVKDKVRNSLIPGEGGLVIGNIVEGIWAEMNWRRWTNVNTRILKSLNNYCILSIDLSKNQLENVIPEFFNGQLPMLNVLVLNDNNIETLPELNYPCNNKLVMLDIKRNRLKELPFVYLCMSRIERVNVCNNNIIRFTFFVEDPHTIYSEAASESNLKALDISSNLLETIPEEIGQFRRMTELKCRENNIENFPSTWHLSSRLEVIDLISNRIGSFPFEHPPGLWKMTLRKMLLADNKLTWIPLFIVKLRMLLLLDLDNNNLHEFPTASAWESQLSELKLANNPLLFTHDYYAISGINVHYENTRPDLSCFEKTLNSLDISNNDLDSVPSFVNCLKNLRFLYLNQNPNLNDLPPELSLLQNLNVISVNGTPLTNLPKEYRPGPDQVFVTAGRIMNYLEDIRLNSETLYSIQLVLMGNPSIVLQRLELDIRGVSRRKLVLGAPKHENITMFDAQLYPGGKANESIFAGKTPKSALKARVWVIDNLSGFRAISSTIDGERTLYIITNDITKRFEGYYEVNEWLQVLFESMLSKKFERVSLFLDLSQQIEKKVQKEIIQTFQTEPINKFHTTFICKDGETVRKEVYQWGQSICSKLRKVPEYMQKILSYLEEKYHKSSGKEREFAYHRNEFIGMCESLTRGHCWSDKDRGECIHLLQSCGYLFHCNDTWANLDNFYFMQSSLLYDFLLRFVATSAIPITTECGKTSVTELKEIIVNYTSSEMVTQAIIAILEQFELAFTITENILLVVQFLHSERPAIIARTELDFESSYYMQTKGNDRKIRETPKHSRYFCFESIPRYFFSLLLVDLTSQSKRGSEFQFTPNVWNLVLWKNGLEAFIENEHILIAQANIDQLSSSLLCAQIMRGRKIIDEQTLELRRVGITYYISVSIYSNNTRQGLQRLGNICDIIENLLRSEQFDTVRESCRRMLPCEGCLDISRFHMLSVEELLDSKEDFYYCENSARKYSIEELLPEYFLKDQPNHILVSKQELNFDKSIAVKIGEGSEGIVYKHMYKGQDVAVKVLHTSKSSILKNRTKEFLDMRKEAVFLQKLQHPYLMGIIAVTTSPLCLVLEYAAHSSLNRVLDYHLEQYGLGAMQNGLLGTILTHQIAIEIVSALNYLHRNKIVYFDLKSANVLVLTLDITSQTHVKLTDYGIAQTVVPRGVKGYKGTLGFMAPELYPDQGVYISVNEKVDVYSYAMFLFELLFGRNPAAGDKNAFEKVKNGVRPKCSIKEIPYYLYNLIHRCWEQMPRMRPSTHEILQELSEVKFVMKNKSWNINIRGEISGAYQMLGTKLPSGKGISLPSNMMENLFPHARTSISLSNSSSATKDLSGSYNTDYRGCTSNFPSINSAVRYDISCDGINHKNNTLDQKHRRIAVQDDSAVILCGSTDKETDIILMKMTTGEYYNDIRIEYPCVTSIAIYNSFMWVAASQKKEEPGMVLLFTLSKMDIMFQQEEEDCIRKIIVFPLEETETSLEVNIIVVMTREIVNYQFKMTGNFIDLNNTKFDINHFCRSTVFESDSLISGACMVNNNELWCCYGKNNSAHVMMYDVSYNEPKLIGALPPINDVIEIGDMICAGNCVWISDKRELILWKIDYRTKNVRAFTELPQLKENKLIGRNGSIIRKNPHLDDSPTRKPRYLTVPKGGPIFCKKSCSVVEECRAVREISHLSDVKTKFKEKMEYISNSNTLHPTLDHINLMDMYTEAVSIDSITSPIAIMHAGVDTVWTFLEDGKICIFDANTPYDQLSVLSLIKTQGEYYATKHMKVPAAVTVTSSHIIIVRKASNKEVLDMDGFDYYVEVWQNLTADEIRSYNRVVLAAHRAV